MVVDIDVTICCKYRCLLVGGRPGGAAGTAGGVAVRALGSAPRFARVSARSYLARQKGGTNVLSYD